MQAQTPTAQTSRQAEIRRLANIFFSGLLLVAVAFGASVLSRAAVESVRGYRSPLGDKRLPHTLPGEPLGRQVVLVVIGGAGYDMVWWQLELPYVEEIVPVSASAMMVGSTPSYNNPSWSTILSGASPELNNAPLYDSPRSPGEPFDDGSFEMEPLAVDNIINMAHEADLNVALYAPEQWEGLVSRDYLRISHFVDAGDPTSDEKLLEAALAAMSDPTNSLVIIRLSRMDYAALAGGGTRSEEYEFAATQTDALLGQLVAGADLKRSTIVVLADHGHLAGGGYGGGEVEVVEVPFLMLGLGVIPGEYSPVNSTDVAPTIALLLGLRLPERAEGRALLEMLSVDDAAKDSYHMQQAWQRATLVDAYLRAIGRDEGLGEEFLVDMGEAQASFDGRNRRGGARLAEVVGGQMADEMANARAAGVSHGRRTRLLVVGLSALVGFLLYRRSASGYWSLELLTALLAFGVYYALNQLVQAPDSLSGVGDFGAFLWGVRYRTAAGVIASSFLLLAAFVSQREKEWQTVVKETYMYGFTVVLVMGLPAVYGFFRNGAALDWYLPPIDEAFNYYVSLVQVVVAAGVSAVLPFLLLPFWGSILWWYERSERLRRRDVFHYVRRR